MTTGALPPLAQPESLGHDRRLVALSVGWGACTFFPVSIAYCCALLMLLALLMRRGLPARLGRLRELGIVWPCAAMLVWVLFIAAAGPWLDDTGTRIFHIVRVLLLIAMGAMLAPAEARAAIAGFLLAAVVAALVVATHRVWGLPDWAIWSSLLRSRNNFSSGNMIMMALAAGSLFYLGLCNDQRRLGRWIPWGGALALGITVIAHSVSRNAQVLVPALMALALIVHYRAWRVIGLAMAGVLLTAALAWQLSPPTQQRFGAIVSETRKFQSEGDYTTSIGVRYLMAQEAWNGMVTQPLMGHGVGSWLPYWREIGTRTGQHLSPEQLERHRSINNPHNEYLLAGMETGIPGMAVLIWLMVAVLRLGWRRRSVAGGLSFLFAAALALTALVNAPLRDAALGMTFLWLLGASFAAARGQP